MAYDDPYWTLDEAISWAIWRREDAISRSVFAIGARLLDDDLPLFLSWDDAASQVLRLMQRGAVRAVSQGELIDPVTLASAGIVNRTVGVGQALHLVSTPAHEGDQSFRGPAFGQLRVNSDDLRLHLRGMGSQPAGVIQLAASKLGAPPIYPWPDFMEECERVWAERGGFMESDPVFSRKTHLVNIMAEWCQAQPTSKGWKDGPSHSSLKARVGDFLRGKGIH